MSLTDPVESNLAPTPLDASADLVIRGRAAEVLPAVRERVGA